MRGQEELEGFIDFEHARKAREALDRPAHARPSVEWPEHAQSSTRIPHWRDRHLEPVSLALVALIGEDAASGVAERPFPIGVGLVENRELLKAPGALLPRTTPRREPHTTPRQDSKVAALEDRVRKLESLIENLLVKQIAERKRETENRNDEDEDEIIVQPHSEWIETNKEKLQAYPNSFVALDIENGIVAHAIDSDEFDTQLDKLSPEQRARVVLFHTSMYVR